MAANEDLRAWIEWARAHVARTNPIRTYVRAIASGKAQKTYCFPPVVRGLIAP